MSSTSLTRPQQFWRDHAHPNVDEFRDDQADIRKAMNAALSVFHMLDYVWVSYGPNANHPDPGKVFNQQSKSALAQYLVDNECTDFALIQDAANAHKHMKITQQPTRVITSAGDTWRQSSGPGISMYIVPVIVIGQRGGTQVDFAPALQNVVTMWEDLIKRFNL